MENVTSGDPEGQRWTQVLETRDGRGIRADYRCTAAATGERYAFEQLLENTPFERILRKEETEIRLTPQGEETEVTMTIERRLRGLSRFGSPMMRRAVGRTVAEALSGLERALAAGDEPAEAST